MSKAEYKVDIEDKFKYLTIYRIQNFNISNFAAKNLFWGREVNNHYMPYVACSEYRAPNDDDDDARCH